MPYRIIMSSQKPGNSLMHYGISGQRWGIRRFQNEDRTFTEAGKRRYYPERNPLLLRKNQPVSDKEKKDLIRRINEAEKNAATAQKEYDKALYRSYNIGIKNLEKEKTFLALHEADKQVQDLKILQKLQNKKFISQHQLNIADRYRDEGMTDEQARVQAYKRVRTEKVIAAAATVTVAMAAAHVAKISRTQLDSIIPKGMKVQNLSTNPDKGVHDAFFAAYDEGDKKKYLNLFGGDHLQRQAQIGKLLGQGTGEVPVAKLTAEAVTDMKIAGANVARDTASQLISSNREYRNALRNIMNDPEFEFANAMKPGGFKGYDNLRSALSGGKLNNDGYNLINTLLASHDLNSEKAGRTLYEALLKKGYDGTIDVNDIWNSGYNAKKPVILFNGANKLGNISRQMMDPAPLRYGAMIEYGKLFMRQALDFYGPIAVGVAGIRALSKAKPIKVSVYRRRVITAYKKEHPNTQLTDQEILKNEIKI